VDFRARLAALRAERQAGPPEAGIAFVGGAAAPVIPLWPDAGIAEIAGIRGDAAGDPGGGLDKIQHIQCPVGGGASVTLFRDYETRSTLELKKVGAWAYASHSSTDVWCCAYAIDDGPIELWTSGQPVPEAFIEAARNPNWIVSAFNDAFETAIEQLIMGPRYSWPRIPIERHRCTRAQVLAAALPGSLEKAAEALALTNKKSDSRLMLRMAKPRKARKGEDPDKGPYWHEDLDDLAQLYAYCRQDVAVEREMRLKAPALSDEEQALWVLDAQINMRGFHTDGALLTGALTIAERIVPAINAELETLTGGAARSVHAGVKIQEWLRAQGLALPDLQRGTVERTLSRNDIDPAVRRVLELRHTGNRAATKKLLPFQRWRSNGDGRVRGAFHFHGAATGRWSSRGIQVHNLKRIESKNFAEVIEKVTNAELVSLPILGEIGRAIICAQPGHYLIAADFSGVESRLTAWVSGQQTKVDEWAKFDRTGDPKDEPYYLNGERMGLAEEDRRGTGKVGDLACGYMGSVGAWRKLSPNDPRSDAEIQALKQKWRELHPETVKFWYALDRAAKAATAKHGAVEAVNTQVVFEHDGKFLWMRLPSGRRLAYPEAYLKDTDREKVVVFKDNASGGWKDCRNGAGAYGGIWTENLVQAVARDLFAAAMLRLEKAGYRVVAHVHDEIVCEVPEGFGSEEEFLRLIKELPDWAQGLPVSAKPRSGHRFSK
jgi:DNA polymerase bacteriophage-type